MVLIVCLDTTLGNGVAWSSLNNIGVSQHRTTSYGHFHGRLRANQALLKAHYSGRVWSARGTWDDLCAVEVFWWQVSGSHGLDDDDDDDDDDEAI